MEVKLFEDNRLGIYNKIVQAIVMCKDTFDFLE
jgi:hypothetical protein